MSSFTDASPRRPLMAADTPPRLPKPSKLWQLTSDDAASCDRTQRVVQHPTAVACLGMYTFVVADSEGHRVLIVDIERNICSTLAAGQVWPNDVAVTGDSAKILVTDRKEKVIKMYDIRGDLLSIWNTGPKCVDDVSTEPHGIAVTSRGEIVVTDTEKNAVSVLSSEGRPLRQFGTKGDLLQQFDLPFFCAVDARDQILVSDNMNYCVKIFDSQGNYQQKIGTGSTFGQRQFQCPYGLCTDPWSDEIFVADYDSHRVFTFGGGRRQDGKFLRYALTNGDGVRNPTGIAMSPSGILVVTECGLNFANVKAFRVYESQDGNRDIEETWTNRIESAV